MGLRRTVRDDLSRSRPRRGDHVVHRGYRRTSRSSPAGIRARRTPDSRPDGGRNGPRAGWTGCGIRYPPMKRILTLSLLLGAGSYGALVAQGTPAQDRLGTNTTALDALLRTAVQQKRVPYAVGAVATAGGVAYEHAEGIGQDAIFSIASMTKPVTSIAIMQLVEAGKVKL